MSSWFANISVLGLSRTIRFKLDTGAEVTAISQKTYNNLPRIPLQKPSRALLGPSQTPLRVLGQFETTIGHKKSSPQIIFVIKGLKNNLLGLPAIISLGLVSKSDSITLNDYTSKIHATFPILFKGLGNLGEEYKIELKPDTTTFALYTP